MLTAAVGIEVSIGDDPNAAIYVVTSVSRSIVRKQTLQLI